MTEASTSTCAEALLSSWISRFGVPDRITTNRGQAFLSELWVALARLMGTTLHSTMSYNPAANGMVERAHRSLKAALMARCSNDSWKAQLPWVLLGLRTAPRAGSDVSPAEKVYGETLAVLGEFFPTATDDADTSLPRLREVAQKFALCRKTFTDRTHVYSPGGLDACTHIFIRIVSHRPPLTRPYRAPYRVISRSSKDHLINIHGREDWVSADRLKPAFLLNSETREETGRRPRIPPQNLATDDPVVIPKRGRGCPNGRTKEITCLAKPPGDSAVRAAPRPQVSRTLGRLLLPKRFRD
ncbi:uncharacterized protein [Macrobrachium rosenbergii]|uniref:uncharacterized protein n=1 Tax=Macrobrachium rosenbergii TaxID=79674 RepID=UPI0034D70CCF